ncbi:MFS transporter, DHA1 family, bicyclomycin/chloramphenicol resistance protein [Yoonia tamlensis]|uniref:MFS transporter, DHA1 family, bicyclomycin/chloramphenicol resistance protein n=1 Tax=Yoonia tamlensis TaxID=390270 RepID=A0A1I6GB77_9RHOB|nr:multidrug effflux MFS transporter [Yoonia tamlensis]SFR39429.1 MFS transporter, DHA1 family, bicyclomycin/chloramphenicol resistance protein [Yoonia tamlensis]
MKRLPQTEFIALMAMLAATVAFSIDAMLPALPQIGLDLTPLNLNRAQLIITSFVFGMGVGTLFTGPLSDAFGRKPVMVGGAIVYILACVIAWRAQSLEVMLFARVVQGLGAAGPRVVAMALVRDLYSGREMARIMSFVMLVFSIVPALAPTVGHYIILGFGWRGIFGAFVVFAAAVLTWLLARQPETLTPENRRPMRVTSIIAAVREMFMHHTARLSILVQTLTFGMLFTVISSTQQVFDQTFGKGEQFHLWFGGIAICASSASVINARLVVRLGMRAIIKAMYTAQIFLTLMLIAVTLFDGPYWLSFGAYVIWVLGNFFQAGLSIGNLNALAMEEMGHIAGLAASVIAAVATVGAVIIAAPVALMFDGTPMPMAYAALVCAGLALWLTTKIKRPGEA